jgi:hypothetical protein
VVIKIIPKIPDVEKSDLKSQLRRSVKAIPRLITEGYAKRHQKHGFQKYLNDAMGDGEAEANSSFFCVRRRAIIWERGLICPRPKNCPPRESDPPNLSRRDFSFYPGNRTGEYPGVSTQHRLLFVSLQNNPGESIHFSNSG